MKNMTVKDLIEYLEKCDPTALVYRTAEGMDVTLSEEDIVINEDGGIWI